MRGVLKLLNINSLSLYANPSPLYRLLKGDNIPSFSCIMIQIIPVITSKINWCSMAPFALSSSLAYVELYIWNYTLENLDDILDQTYVRKGCSYIDKWILNDANFFYSWDLLRNVSLRQHLQTIYKKGLRWYVPPS